MSQTVTEEFESKKDTFRRYFRNCKKELERENTDWSRLQRWMKLASEEATRCSELQYIKRMRSNES